ncbi:hypothetical protein ACFWBN_34755 [Streptomyces sp. NPDC059989]|uniref:hypothetical protein n=1 Tax=Streptomyces sp. NPDC059989 TaxID=3347026 RepID=UPI0036CD4B55
MDDGIMNGEEARAVIRSQEERTRLRLEEAIRAHGHKAQALADALEPWRGGRSANLWGTATKPGALKAFYDAYEWLEGGANTVPGALRYSIVTSKDPSGRPRATTYAPLDLDRYPKRRSDRLHEQIRSGKADNSIENLHWALRELAETCREASVAPVLHLPDDVHPPRHGKLPDGVIARNLAEDITAAIAQGRALHANLAAGLPPLPALESWRDSTRRATIFRAHDLMEGIEACRASIVPDPTALGRAYLAIALEYLEELMDRLPDYAEASGQSKHDQVTVHGNVGVIGSVSKSHISVAETVTNIGTATEALAGRGDTDLAVAIRALTQAIQQASELADDQRAQLLDNVADIADAAAAPDAPRSLSRARAAMAVITSAAGASTQLTQAAGTLHQVASQLF